MNKKGFTLIELLAIIVILAVIALIGTPIVSSIINASRMGAASRTCDGVVDAVKQIQAVAQMNNANFGGATVEFGASGATVTPTVDGQAVENFNFSGTLPTAGEITIGADGTYTWGILTVNGYTCTATTDGRYTCSES